MSQKPLSYCYMISQVKNKGRKAQEEVKLWSSKELWLLESKERKYVQVGTEVR